MRKWLYDNPWIWIVLFLGTLVAGSIATVIIAEVNRPEIVKPKDKKRPRTGASTLVVHSDGFPVRADMAAAEQV